VRCTEAVEQAVEQAESAWRKQQIEGFQRARERERDSFRMIDPEYDKHEAERLAEKKAQDAQYENEVRIKWGLQPKAAAPRPTAKPLDKDLANDFLK